MFTGNLAGNLQRKVRMPMDRNQTEKTQQLDRSVQSERKLNLEELTTFIYNLLYYIGSKVMRYSKHAAKRVKHSAVKCWWFAKRNVVCFGDFLVEQKNEILRHSWIDPFRSIVGNWKRDFSNLYHAIVKLDGEAVKDTLFDMLHTFRFVGNVVNYVLPVAAAFVFITTFQEIDFGVIKPRVAAFMKDLDAELWQLGILAKTEHNEAAPAQHELAPIFSTTNIATDKTGSPWS